MEGKIIPLYNRDGDTVYLEKIEDNKYLLHFDGYCSALGTFPNYKSIDPVGGPCISVGGYVEGMLVKSITFVDNVGCIIEVSNETL